MRNFSNTFEINLSVFNGNNSALRGELNESFDQLQWAEVSAIIASFEFPGLLNFTVRVMKLNEA